MNRPNNIKRKLCNNYTLVTDKMSNEDSQNYISYGIKLISFRKTYIIRDISTNKCFVKNAINLFNKYKLSPIHFREAVENILP